MTDYQFAVFVIVVTAFATAIIGAALLQMFDKPANPDPFADEYPGASAPREKRNG